MKIDLTEEHLRQEVTIAVPLGWLLERGALAQVRAIEPLRRVSDDRTHLPMIGEPFSNEAIEEVYAGCTLYDGECYALVLLPGDFEGSWQDAGAWAERQGGMLPSRVDMLILWQNLKGHFKKETYWTSEQTAVGADWAWCQGFNYGTQGCSDESSKLRARAVRRVPL